MTTQRMVDIYCPGKPGERCGRFVLSVPAGQPYRALCRCGMLWGAKA